MFESKDGSFRYLIRHPNEDELGFILESWWDLVGEQSAFDNRADRTELNIEKSKRFIESLSERNFLLIAFDLTGDEVIGMGSVYPDNFFLSGGPSIWNVADVWVRKDKRRNGVAKNLVFELERLAKDSGAQELRLEVYSENIGAHSLYSSIEFSKLKETLNKKI